MEVGLHRRRMKGGVQVSRRMSGRFGGFLGSALVVAICLVATAVPAFAAPPERGAAPRPQSVAALLDAYLAAWNAHDAERAAGMLDEHVTYDDALAGASQKGRTAAQQAVIAALFKAVPDLAWRRVAPPIVAGDSVAFQWVRQGTNTGDWSDGTKATGKAFEVRGSTILRLHDYKVLYQGDYYDPAAMKRPAGK